MKSKLFLLAIIAVMITSASFAQRYKKKYTGKINQSPALANLDWQGRYFGNIPNASGTNTETIISLGKGNSYTISTTSIGKDSKPETVTGQFVWRGNTIKINNKTKNITSVYKIEENQIVKLDAAGKEIKNTTDYILKKMGNTEVEDKRWQLIELNGKAVSGTAELHYIIFHSQSGNAESKAGCNQLVNRYAIKNKYELNIKQGISTRMACPNAKTENEFMEVLTTANNIAIQKNVMSLNKNKMAPLAKFILVKSTDASEFIGKTFYQKAALSNDPELGGVAFLKIIDNNNGEILNGDILQNVKISIGGQSIVVSDEGLAIKREFKIIDGKRLQEGNIDWIAE
jgi:heat shock protein HslJ